MRVSILDVAKRPDLDDQSFKELVNEGKLFGIWLDEACLQKARRALFGDQSKPLPRRRGGRHD